MPETSELAAIVGTQNVLTSQETLQEYARDLSFVSPKTPAAVVKAGTASEVHSIVKWASNTQTPLIPVSSGAPHRYGDTVPTVDDAVIIDLTGMKKIIRIDRRNRNVMIEPGVTYGELIPALEKEGLAPFISLLPRESKSVIADFLERAPITMPRHHWDAQDPLQCVEVYYGDGELMRSGSAPGPGTIEEQWKAGRAQVRGIGPSQLDLTRILQGAQGTMGIVTWATLRCRLLPKAGESFFIASDELQPLIDLAYQIIYKKLGEELMIFNKNQLYAAAGQPKGASDKSLPSWVLYFGIEGNGFFPEDKVDYQKKELEILVKAMNLELKAEIGDINVADLSAVLSRPTPNSAWKTGSQAANEDIFFLTTLDKSPEFITNMQVMLKDQGMSEDNMGIYIQPTTQGRNCHLEFSIQYDPENASQKKSVKKLSFQGARKLAKNGGFFSRPYGNWKDFAFDEAGLAEKGLKQIRSIFDPNGILNPGKICF